MFWIVASLAAFVLLLVWRPVIALVFLAIVLLILALLLVAGVSVLALAI